MGQPSLSALQLRELAAAPSSPASGDQLVYPRSDGKWYTKNSAGVEKSIILSDDTRLTDARTPTAHTIESHSNILAGPATAGDGLIYESGSWNHRGLQLTDLPEAWIKRTCQAASVANITIASPGFTSLDGVALTIGNRILVKDQTTLAQNGIYTYNGSSSPMTRTADGDSADDLAAAIVSVEAGTVNGGTRWVNSFKVTDVLGTTGMTWGRNYDAAVADTMPGSEMAYSERTTSFTTTNTTLISATLGIVTGMQVSVVGEGRAVDFEFEASMQHTVANTFTAAWLIANVASAGNSVTTSPGGYVGGVSHQATGSTRIIHMKRRMVLTAGVSYVVQVGVGGGTAGTTTLFGSSTVPSWLAVTRH